MEQISELIKSYFINDKSIICVYLFGSVALNLETQKSDIDIAILINEDLKIDYLDYDLNISSELTEILHKPIDIVILNEATPLLYFRILKYGKLILDKEPDKRAEYEMKILSYYYDYKRFFDFHIKYFHQRLLKRDKYN